MAQHIRDFSEGGELADPAHQLVNVDGELRIRQLNVNGVYDPAGTYGQGRITIDSWHPRALTAINGFVAHADVSGTDQVVFRLSPDSGVTELFWNGTAWATAVNPTADWNTEDVVDANIATFPLVDGITQIVRLVSGTGATTPALKTTTIFYEADYESTVDLMESLARTIAAGLTIKGVFRVTVPIPGVPPTPTPAPSNQVLIDDPIWTVNDPVQVFNDTTDPYHRTNLYVSRVGNQLTLSAVQTGALTVLYVGTIDLTKIHIATDYDIELADLPAIVLQTPTAMRVRYERTPEDDEEETLRSRSVVRLRKSPTFQDVSMIVQCNGAYELHARKLRDSVRAFLEKMNNVQSLALDEPYVRTAVGPITTQHDLTEQTFTFNVAVTFTVLDLPVEYTEVPMTELVAFSLRTVVPSSTVDGEGQTIGTVETIEIQSPSGNVLTPPIISPDGIARSYTAGVELLDAVYQKSDGTVDRASASNVGLNPVIGFVASRDVPTVGAALVQLDGDLDGFSGLVPGITYILGLAPGSILRQDDVSNPNYPTLAGQVVQRVGIAVSSTKLLIAIGDEIEL